MMVGDTVSVGRETSGGDGGLQLLITAIMSINTSVFVMGITYHLVVEKSIRRDHILK